MLRRTVILLFLLASSGLSAELPTESELSPAQYRAELDRIAQCIDTLKDDPQQAAILFTTLSPIWHVHAGEHTFDISTEWLRPALQRFEHHPETSIPDELASRLHLMRFEAQAFEGSTPDVASRRQLLHQILARQEFQGIRGPTWIDSMKQRLLKWVFGMLTRVFGSSSVPTISKIVVYSLVGLAV